LINNLFKIMFCILFLGLFTFGQENSFISQLNSKGVIIKIGYTIPDSDNFDSLTINFTIKNERQNEIFIFNPEKLSFRKSSIPIGYNFCNGFMLDVGGGWYEKVGFMQKLHLISIPTGKDYHYTKSIGLTDFIKKKSLIKNREGKLSSLSILFDFGFIEQKPQYNLMAIKDYEPLEVTKLNLAEFFDLNLEREKIGVLIFLE
jgi:hypothetical protein